MGGEVRWLTRRLGGTAELAMRCVLGRISETQGLDVLGKGRPVMRSLSVVGVVRVKASRSSSWCRVVPQPSVLLLRLVWIQLRVDWRHIAEPNVVACSDAGKHAGHVVEEDLDGALGWRLLFPRPGVECWVRHWAWRQWSWDVFEHRVNAWLRNQWSDRLLQGRSRGSLPSILFWDIRPLLGVCV